MLLERDDARRTPDLRHQDGPLQSLLAVSAIAEQPFHVSDQSYRGPSSDERIETLSSVEPPRG